MNRAMELEKLNNSINNMSDEMILQVKKFIEKLKEENLSAPSDLEVRDIADLNYKID